MRPALDAEPTGQEINYHYVYFMASQRNGTIYTGKTNNLIKRIPQHKAKIIPNNFTAEYNVVMLAYFEQFEDHWNAAAREKAKKIAAGMENRIN